MSGRSAAVTARPGGLWRHPEFRKLWAGQTLSLLGSQVTLLALPLAAIVTLQASPSQLGVLNAAGRAPFLLLGLVAGVWVDRLRQRPVLVAADLGRAAVLVAIPLAALAGHLAIWHLYVATLMAGALTVFFEVAYQSYLPSLVAGGQLLEGNSKLEISRSSAQVAGPTLAGALVQAVGAPLAILADVASFVLSGAFLASIRASGPAPLPAKDRPRALAAVAEGLRAVRGSPLLRPIATATVLFNCFASGFFTLYLLFLTRDLRLAPGVIGLVLAAIGPGLLMGAMAAGRVTRALGVGPAMVWLALVGDAAILVVPLAAGPTQFVVALLVVSGLVSGFANQIFNLNQTTLRQRITPLHLQGRVTATMRTIAWSAAPLGALLGGVLGDAVGVRPALLVMALGLMLAFLRVLLSPLRTLREIPDRPQDPADLPAAPPTEVGGQDAQPPA